MADVRLTATNPDDSSVVPVACNEKGELKLEEPLLSEGPPGKDGDPFSGNFADDVTFDGSGEFAGRVTAGEFTVGADAYLGGNYQQSGVGDARGAGILRLTDTGGTQGAQQAFRITQNGNQPNNATIALNYDGTGTFAGDVTAFSDITLKENIEVIPAALDKISEIRGVTFNRTDQENEQRHAGVIAQEVEAVLPEVVSTNNDGIKSVAYGNLVSLLIEAVKELKTEVETLKAKRNR